MSKKRPSKKPRKRRINSQKHSPRRQPKQKSLSKKIKENRTLIIFLLVMIVAGGGLWMNSRNKISNTIEPQKQSSTEPNLKPNIDLFTQSTINFPPELNWLINKKHELYPQSLNLPELIGQLKKDAQNGPEGMNELQKPLAQKMLGNILETDFLDRLQNYKDSNAEQNKSVSLILIPQGHSNPNIPEDSEIWKMVNQCFFNIRNILNILHSKYQKIFYEGMDVEGRVTETKYRKKVKVLYEHSPQYAQGGSIEEAVNIGIQNIKNSERSWVLDPQFTVFGTTHKKFETANLENMNKILSPIFANILGDFSNYYSVVINGLLKEQYAIEKAIADLEEGETGVIIMGTTHIPTMQQYIADQHPNVQTELMVPKNLFDASKFIFKK